jgi:hypothetical protein
MMSRLAGRGGGEAARAGENRGPLGWRAPCFGQRVMTSAKTSLLVATLLLAAGCDTRFADGLNSGGYPGGPPSDPAAAPGNQGDHYRAPGTNPFVSTSKDPFSTFAADVDTASYDIFRRDVSPFADRNLLPQIEAITTSQAGRDADRAEFAALFAKARARL